MEGVARMEGIGRKLSQEDWERYSSWASKKLKEGYDSADIIFDLEGFGVDKENAIKVAEAAETQTPLSEDVETLHTPDEKEQPSVCYKNNEQDCSSFPENEEFAAKSILYAIAGGGLAAVVGGILWGLIAVATGYEIGYAAWGIGILTGFAVLLFSKGGRGFTFQIISSAASLIGIIVGKYIAFCYLFPKLLTDTFGAEFAQTISFKPYSMDSFAFFIKSLGSVHDFIWFALAVISAWRITREEDAGW